MNSGNVPPGELQSVVVEASFLASGTIQAMNLVW
jgi:hypothetical protein